MRFRNPCSPVPQIFLETKHQHEQKQGLPCRRKSPMIQSIAYLPSTNPFVTKTTTEKKIGHMQQPETKRDETRPTRSDSEHKQPRHVACRMSYILYVVWHGMACEVMQTQMRGDTIRCGSYDLPAYLIPNSQKVGPTLFLCMHACMHAFFHPSFFSVLAPM